MRHSAAYLEAGWTLLFGVLALQTGLIGRDDLVAALGAWAHGKSRPLGDILWGMDRLAEEERGLLDGLGRAQLERHGGDPGRGLAAVGAPAWLREDLARIPDAGVREFLGHLSTARCDP